MELGLGRFDWVSFLVETDADAFQATYLPLWNAAITERIPEGLRRKKSRVHALGATKTGRRRYVLSVWGEYAHLADNLNFAFWAEYLTRVDIRTTLYDCADDTFDRLTTALQYAETRNNIETFNVSKRTKNHARDAGGKGVRFGSRKSDVSTKLYRRGKEKPAVETQIIDDRLKDIVSEVEEAQEDTQGVFDGWNALRSALASLQDKHLTRWLFSAGIEKSLEDLRFEDIPMPGKLRQMFQLDMWADGAPLPLPDDELPEPGASKRERGG